TTTTLHNFVRVVVLWRINAGLRHRSRLICYMYVEGDFRGLPTVKIEATSRGHDAEQSKPLRSIGCLVPRQVSRADIVAHKLDTDGCASIQRGELTIFRRDGIDERTRNCPTCIINP